MFSLLNGNDEDNVNDYILTARIPSGMSVQIIQTPHGFSLIATRNFAPGEHVLDLAGIPKSTKDLLIDYRECKPTTGTRARLVILGSPKGITPGVAEFTVFGQTVVTK